MLLYLQRSVATMPIQRAKAGYQTTPNIPLPWSKFFFSIFFLAKNIVYKFNSNLDLEVFNGLENFF